MTGKVLIFTVILLSALVARVPAGESFSGTVRKVIDGDSLLIAAGKKTVEVRLYGVDCPEYNQPFSPQAKALVRTSVAGKKVLVRPLYHDSYNRLVAIVVYGDKILNGELVRAGLAWVYPRYCRKKICKTWQEMENSAKNDKRGMWRSTAPIPPWQWKRMKRGK